VIWLFLRRALVLVAAGLVIGMAGSFGVGQLLRSILVRSNGRELTVLLSIAVLMTAVALVACTWPTRRATRLDPVTALRYE
jgi:putative ABC transport system permease protein